MSRVYWDSMLFIYLLEANPSFGLTIAGILKEIQERRDILCTSVFSIGEVLAGPRKRGYNILADQAMSFFSGKFVEILPFDLKTADQFSKVRATTNAGPPDAIHLATAAIARVDVFFTNDKKLMQLKVPGIQYISGLDRRIYSKYQE